MDFNRLVELEAEARALSGTALRDHVLRIIREAGTDAPVVAMMLCGKLTGPSDDRVTGIKETFLANDLAVDSKAMEDIIAAAQERIDEVPDGEVSIAMIWKEFQDHLDARGAKDVERSEFVTLLMEMATTKPMISFLLRLLVGKMRNSIGEATILSALSDPDADVKRAYALRPDLQWWVQQWLDNGHSLDLKDFGPTLFQAVQPQLCEGEKDFSKVVEKHHPKGTMVQTKYDGERVHIHLQHPTQVCIYSRDLKELSEQYPEVTDAALTLPVESAILDGELVAIKPDGTVLPFSEVQKRFGRKSRRSEVQVGVVLYDILALDGENLMDEPYSERLAALVGIVDVKDPVFRVARTEYVETTERLLELMEECRQNEQEGLVCKDPESVSYPGVRAVGRYRPWIKLKRLGDSIDLVVIGYNEGRGKRHGKVGALWVGALHEGYVYPVCKVGSGLKDADLDWFTDHLIPRDDRSPLIDISGVEPSLDVWVEPRVVVEVVANEMTQNKKWLGFSLRFPRFVRRRDDKTVADVTSVERIKEAFQ